LKDDLHWLGRNPILSDFDDIARHRLYIWDIYVLYRMFYKKNNPWELYGFPWPLYHMIFVSFFELPIVEAYLISRILRLLVGEELLSCLH